MMKYIVENQGMVVMALGWAVSELLVFFPAVKSNSVIQLAFNIVKQVIDKASPK